MIKNILPNPLKIQSRIINDVSCLKKDLYSNLFIIRHAESRFNKAIHDISEGLKNKNISKNEFDQRNSEIRFGQDFIDPPLTDLGQDQCLEAANILKTLEIKYVFVSPLVRTLMTLESIIERVNKNSSSKKINPKVVVHPIIFEKIEDSCDLILDLNKNRKNFSHYDWSLFDRLDHPPAYQLKYCNEVGLNLFEKAIAHFKINNVYDHHKLILKEMEKLSIEKKFIESSLSTFDRLENFDSYLKSYMEKNHVGKDENILIVGHSVLFRHLMAKTIHEDSKKPNETETLKNCQIANIKRI